MQQISKTTPHQFTPKLIAPSIGNMLVSALNESDVIHLDVITDESLLAAAPIASTLYAVFEQGPDVNTLQLFATPESAAIMFTATTDDWGFDYPEARAETVAAFNAAAERFLADPLLNRGTFHFVCEQDAGGDSHVCVMALEVVA